jgi:hypothetical protein
MGWILGLSYLLEWKRFLQCGRFDTVEITIFLINKIFSYAGNLPVCGFAPFMIVASAYGGSWSVHGDVYIIGEYDEEIY